VLRSCSPSKNDYDVRLDRIDEFKRVNLGMYLGFINRNFKISRYMRTQKLSQRVIRRLKK
jgi:hypothetical protein